MAARASGAPKQGRALLDGVVCRFWAVALRATIAMSCRTTGVTRTPDGGTTRSTTTTAGHRMSTSPRRTSGVPEQHLPQLPRPRLPQPHPGPRVAASDPRLPAPRQVAAARTSTAPTTAAQGARALTAAGHTAADRTAAPRPGTLGGAATGWAGGRKLAMSGTVTVATRATVPVGSS